MPSTKNITRAMLLLRKTVSPPRLNQNSINKTSDSSVKSQIPQRLKIYKMQLISTMQSSKVSRPTTRVLI